MSSALPRDQQEKILDQLKAGEEEGLRALLEVATRTVHRYLVSRLGSTLHEHEIKQTIDDTAFKLWNEPEQLDLSRGGLIAWFTSVSYNAALDLVRKKSKQPQVHDCYDELLTLLRDLQSESRTQSETQRKLLELLDSAIEELGGLQKLIIKADLAEGGDPIDGHELAARFQTTVNTIYSSRSKAHATLKKRLEQVGYPYN